MYIFGWIGTGRDSMMNEDTYTLTRSQLLDLIVLLMDMYIENKTENLSDCLRLWKELVNMIER